MLSKVRETGR